MDFKESVKDDWDVFINLEEFADEHDLNGTITKAIVQSPTSREKLISGADYSGYNGISGVTAVIHCRTKDLPEMPIEGQIFTLDEKIFLVSSVTDYMGLLSIELQAHEG